MFDRTAHWQAVYTTKAEDEVSWFEQHPATSLRLIKDAQPSADSVIIDIGGGASRLVDALAGEGFRSLAVLDVSAAALEAAKTRLGPTSADIEWINADVTRWQPARIYDIWHDRAAFHFLTEKADRDAYVERLTSAIAPGGQVIIGTFALDGPERCSGLSVQRHDAASLAEVLGAAFELADNLAEVHRTPWGAMQHFQFSRFKRL
jgi:trans-aconitate methyltransferase